MFKNLSIAVLRRRSVVLGSGLVALMLAWSLALLMADKPPDEAFDTARRALSKARQAEAARYAPAWFKSAEEQWAIAFTVWQRENARWFVLRDYTAAEQAAALASSRGERAAFRAHTVRDSLRWTAEAGLPLVRDHLDLVRAQMDHLPFDPGWHAAVTDIQDLLADGEGALARQDYWTAAEKTRRAAAGIRQIGINVSYSVQDYLENLPVWQRWQAETVAWSAQHKAPAIVVDKMAHRLHVYVAGRLQQTFEVDLGPSWLGPKQHEGDLSTPEGRYHIFRKRGAGETVYFRALEINYPNAEDRRRFREAREQGTLSADTRIGGRIEIHGEGGRGVNWTQGCIALHNPDMEALFRVARKGTPVTIVGALEMPAFADELLAIFEQAGTTMTTP